MLERRRAAAAAAHAGAPDATGIGCRQCNIDTAVQRVNGGSGRALANFFTSGYVTALFGERPEARAVDSRRRDRPGMAGEASRYLGVGMTWALSTALFLWLGTLLDGRWNTEPIFTLLGAFVGAAAGFYYMYHHLVTMPQQRERERRAQQEKRDDGEARG